MQLSFFGDANKFTIFISHIDNDSCAVKVNLTSCIDDDNLIDTKNEEVNEQGSATFEFNSAIFYGKDVKVTVKTCLNCRTLNYRFTNASRTG